MTEKILISVSDQIHDAFINLHALADEYKDYPEACITFDYSYEQTEICVTYERLENEKEYQARLDKLRTRAEKDAIKQEKKREKALQQFIDLKNTYGFE